MLRDLNDLIILINGLQNNLFVADSEISRIELCPKCMAWVGYLTRKQFYTLNLCPATVSDLLVVEKIPFIKNNLIEGIEFFDKDNVFICKLRANDVLED